MPIAIAKTYKPSKSQKWSPTMEATYLKLHAQGYTDVMAARALGLASSTVRDRRGRLRLRSNGNSALHLAKIQEGLERARTERASGAPFVRCKHCNVGRAGRTRGLCWRCSTTPEIRDQHPTHPSYRASAQVDFYGTPPLGVPTRAVPGTAEKIAELMDRAAKKLSLFNPKDGPDLR